MRTQSATPHRGRGRWARALVAVAASTAVATTGLATLGASSAVALSRTSAGLTRCPAASSWEGGTPCATASPLASSWSGSPLAVSAGTTVTDAGTGSGS